MNAPAPRGPLFDEARTDKAVIDAAAPAAGADDARGTAGLSPAILGITLAVLVTLLICWIYYRKRKPPGGKI